MVEKFDSASQKVTPRDAQKGGQGALSKEHPEIGLKQDAPPAGDVPPQKPPPTEGLSVDQIELLCEIEERDATKLTQDKSRDIERLLSKGYIESADESLGPRLRLTEKAIDLLRQRGVGPNEA
jgi:hypothetical protein